MQLADQTTTSENGPSSGGSAQANTAAELSAAQRLVEVFDSQFFKALSEPTRVDILKFLIMHGQADVGEIAAGGRTHRSVVSRHLQIMHQAGILTRSREGRHVLYDVNAAEFILRLDAISQNIKVAAMACCPEVVEGLSDDSA
ncbi:MAG TPA: metalloregulator ArsR/SmtB family transcription factor [Gammaproteobacteria bacterium]|nr:metalloregulator ArsR/SmtB family transcription factor [Gammaproteobacteria bacterium]